MFCKFKFCIEHAHARKHGCDEAIAKAGREKYGSGGGLVAGDTLSDAAFVTLAEGLRWQESGGRTRTQSDLTEWLGKRATAGRMAPRGFPRDNMFN